MVGALKNTVFVISASIIILSIFYIPILTTVIDPISIDLDFVLFLLGFYCTALFPGVAFAGTLPVFVRRAIAQGNLSLRYTVVSVIVALWSAGIVLGITNL